MITLNEERIKEQVKGLSKLTSGDPMLLLLLDRWQKGEHAPWITFGMYLHLLTTERETTALHYAFIQGIRAAYHQRTEEEVSDEPKSNTRWWLVYAISTFSFCLSLYVIINHGGFWAWLLACAVLVPALIGSASSAFSLLTSGNSSKGPVVVPPMYSEESRERFLSEQGKETFDGFYERYGSLDPDKFPTDL